MYSAKVYAVGVEIELEEPDVKTLWKRLSFFQSLPEACPIDDTPTRLYYKEPEGNSYFSVCNSGRYHFEYKLGQYREGGELFGKGEWWWWDWENKEDVLLCRWGELTPDGERMREACKGSTPVAHKGGTPKHEQQEVDAITINDVDEIPFGFEDDNPFEDEPLRTATQNKIIHAIGSSLYGVEWDERRASKVKDKYHVDSSGDLTVSQADDYIEFLCKVARAGLKRIRFADGELDTLLATANDGEAVALDSASAMVLSKVLKVARKKKQPA